MEVWNFENHEFSHHFSLYVYLFNWNQGSYVYEFWAIKVYMPVVYFCVKTEFLFSRTATLVKSSLPPNIRALDLRIGWWYDACVRYILISLYFYALIWLFFERLFCFKSEFTNLPQVCQMPLPQIYCQILHLNVDLEEQRGAERCGKTRTAKRSSSRRFIDWGHWSTVVQRLHFSWRSHLW